MNQSGQTPALGQTPLRGQGCACTIGPALKGWASRARHLDMSPSRGMYTRGTAACVDSTRALVVLPVPADAKKEGRVAARNSCSCRAAAVAARGAKSSGATERRAAALALELRSPGGVRGMGAAARRAAPGGPSKSTARGRLPLPLARVRWAMDS